jgi:hypothetical protein
MLRALLRPERLTVGPALLLLAAACSGDYSGAERSDAPTTTAGDGETPLAEPPEDAPDVEGWKTDWSKSTIDLSELTRGIGSSDPRDAIPPLDDPAFESVADASQWLEGREPVAYLELAGEARAYPLRILTWHEIVNDEVAGTPVAVTYCPLCNSAVGFDRRADGQTLRLGVSGLLRNSDLVMWDRQTESLWQQITGEAIVGELAGTQLDLIPTPIISWADFQESFPDGTVLSRETGFGRSYGTNPYNSYDTSTSPFLFSGELDDRYPAMERVVGVTAGDASKAFPFSVLEEETAVNDTVGDVPIAVFWGAADTASALDAGSIPDGRAVGVGIAYLRTVKGRILTFEPAGEDAFRDAETGSTWDLLGTATDGPLKGAKLQPAVHTNHLWFAWAAFNSGSPVYSGEEG